MIFRIAYRIGLLILVASLFLVSGRLVMAQDQKQVTIINPIRGSDFWQGASSILEVPRNEYQIISQNNLAATWLVRYDALGSSEVVNFLKGLNSSQEVGLFLEVTPSLTKEAGVVYNQSPNWHYAKSVLVIGYSPDDRKRIIDTAVKRFEETIGYKPKSVGAWWIDADSLSYLHDRYGVMTNLDVADQYSTDQYQVWGQYFSLPFYPSKGNALLTAQSAEHKIGTVTVQWATRDPFNSYGNGVGDSTFSVQSNDYYLHGLGTGYFEKLLNIYPQVSVGLENDFDWKLFGGEYHNQIKLLKSKQVSGAIEVRTMDQFGQYYRARYPQISPNVLLQADDPLGSSGKVVWYQTPKYRVGWFYNYKGSVIRDLRIYNESSQEICLKVACNNLNLATTFINSIDEVTYRSSWVVDEGKISNVKVTSLGDQVRIDYTNQAGVARFIRFLPNDVDINGRIYTLASAIMQAHIEPKSPAQKISYSDGGPIDYGLMWRTIWPNLVKFLVLCGLFFILPGWLLTRRWILAIPVGWVVFTLAAFGLGYLHFDVGLWLIPIVSVLAWVKIRPRLSRPGRLDWKMVGLTLVGSLSWLLTVAKSGLMYPFGLGYWGPNGHDAIWHLALINELGRQFPPQNPVFAGVALNNYHYFFDLLLARSGMILGIDNQELLFRLFPVAISLLAGWLMYRVADRIVGSKGAWLATFLLYFGGSFGWIVTWFKEHSFGGESLFWSQQSVSTLLNPPFAISVVLLLAGLLLFVEAIQDQRRGWRIILPLVLLWGSLIEFKVYAGVLVLGSLLLVALYSLVRFKELFWVKVLVDCVVLSLAVFLPNNHGAAGLIVWSPLWLVNSMIDFPDRLGWQRLAMARQTYDQTGNGFKLVVAEILGIVIFIIGNLGLRFLMLGGLFKQLSKSLRGDLVAVFLGSVFLGGLILPLLFIQTGTNWNIVQFFYYSLLVANILTAGVLVRLTQRFNGRVQLLVIGLFCLLNLPTTLSTLKQYWPYQAPASLPKVEIEALNFLKTQPVGSVMTLPFDENARNNFTEPIPLLAYTSTAYVAAFSGHPTFLEDTINLEILGVDYRGRLNDQRDFGKLVDKTNEILRRNNIAYVYVVKAAHFQEDESRMGLKKIFENDQVKIFKVL